MHGELRTLLASHFNAMRFNDVASSRQGWAWSDHGCWPISDFAHGHNFVAVTGASPSDAATSLIIAIRTSLVSYRSRNPIHAYEPAKCLIGFHDRMSERKGRDGDPQTLPHLKIGKRNSVGRKSDSTRKFDVRAASSRANWGWIFGVAFGNL